MRLFKLFLKVGAIGVVVIGLVIAGMIAFVLVKKQRFAKMPDTHDLKRRTQEIGQRHIKKFPNGALVIGITQRGKTFVTGFGRTDPTNNIAPNGKTIFEIGSISKVFTGIVLAEMIRTARVEIDDPISKYLPPGKIPDGSVVGKITLRQLATHSSGLPRMPSDFPNIDSDNPYARVGVEDLYRSLAKTELAQPGKESAYSNFGFAVLGRVLELRADKPNEQLVREIICSPLGMSDTVIRLSPDQRSRFIEGHDAKGKVVAHWDFDAYAPAGAIRSDVDDMLKFVAANLAENDSDLSKTLTEARKTFFSNNSDNIGLAWQKEEMLEGLKILWHNGGTGGFRSFMAIAPGSQTGIILLSNSGDNDDADAMGMELIKIAAKISLD